MKHPFIVGKEEPNKIILNLNNQSETTQKIGSKYKSKLHS